MTLVELLLTYVLLALLLVLMVGVSEYVQRQARRQLAEDMVLTLRETLLAYHASVGRFPGGWADGESTAAITVLLGEPACARVLQDWPVTLSAPRQPAHYVDPWGRSFRYLTTASGAEHRERVTMDGGVPIFESAGPDGDFGDTDLQAREDNLASDFTMIIKQM